MSISAYFKDINLTSDQKNAINAIENFLNSNNDVFILKGYAGTGKTTLLKGIAAYIDFLNRSYQIMAPTGRAARVIHQKTGLEAITIHKGIYNFDKLEEKETGSKEKSIFYYYKIKDSQSTPSVIIIDEASMVSDSLNENDFFRFGSGCLLKDLFSYAFGGGLSTKIIFIGDPAQLPPVGMNLSPALDRDYLEKNYNLKILDAQMKEIIRQDINSGILKSATILRKCLERELFNHFDLRENKKDIFDIEIGDFKKVYKDHEDSKVIITYKNRTAYDINIDIRKERFSANLPIQSGDRIIIGKNNYKLDVMNGEMGVVLSAQSATVTRTIQLRNKEGKVPVALTWRRVKLLIENEKEENKIIEGYILENYLHSKDSDITKLEQQALYVDFKIRHSNLKPGSLEFKEQIKNDPFFNAIFLKYGYAITCHKAQGGEWENVFVFWDNPIGKRNSTFYRWAYTAITRTSKRLFNINAPYFTPFSNMSFMDIAIQETYSKSSTIEISREKVIPILKEFNLENDPISIQEHFIQRWLILNKRGITIKSLQKVGYEIRYIFEKGKDSAAFIYWINKKDEFNGKYKKFPSKTSSDELFHEISQILENSPKIVIKQENKNKREKVEISFENDKPFLKELYECIKKHLDSEIEVSKIEHLDYKDRYTFTKDNQKCVIDFEYNKSGFFNRVFPIESKCNSLKLYNEIKKIVSLLKENSDVI